MLSILNDKLSTSKKLVIPTLKNLVFYFIQNQGGAIMCNTVYFHGSQRTFIQKQGSFGHNFEAAKGMIIKKNLEYSGD